VRENPACFADGQAIDTLAAFGPKRMDYECLITLAGIAVRLSGNALSLN
jgi:hypothetical protein